jgi:hypothetical protein
MDIDIPVSLRDRFNKTLNENQICMSYVSFRAKHTNVVECFIYDSRSKSGVKAEKSNSGAGIPDPSFVL